MLQGKVSQGKASHKKRLTMFLGTAVLAISLGGAAQAQQGYRDPSVRVAHVIGFEDGSLVGRQDLFHGKAFQPFPRGKYAHEDRGYHREYGDKFAYEQEYANGYRAGYQRAFRR
ncbi:MAG: hypothetical protein ABSE92_13895 [Terriglobales bacterium]|jgi:hypothetical protein